jgi:hypothetical protein
MQRWRIAAALAAGAALGLLGGPARASSHAEAPMIAEDPAADNTDLYFFRSPENPDRVVILANYIPLEEPSGGPTYKYFSDRVRYEINIDRNNDGKDDLSFQFQFTTRTQTPGTFLPYLGPISQLTTNGSTQVQGNNVNPNYNKFQTYTVTMVEKLPSGRTRATVLTRDVIVPPNNAGPTTCPNFAALVGQAIHTIPGSGIRTYAGQIDDPFFIDLGAVFDLLQVRPFRSLSALPNNGQDHPVAPDALAGFNCHTIAMEIPITFLTRTQAVPGPNDAARLLGVYASASRRRISVLREGGAADRGDWVQVSRLGAPLVNELFIPIRDPQGRTRDAWNAREPEGDAIFRRFFQFPEPALRLAQIYPVLRPVIPNINADASGFTGPRTDLLGGATPLLNFVPDFLRLDVSVPPNPNPNRLGALGGDSQGFPNGRRLADDVVDIYMRAAAGALVPGDVTVGNFTGSRGAFLDAINFGDGVDAHTDGQFLSHFPFAATAHDGVNPGHRDTIAEGLE